MMINQDKIKLKKLLDSIRKIPEENDMVKEIDKTYSLILKIKELQHKYELYPKDGYKEYKEEFIKLCDIKLSNRIFKIISAIEMKYPLRKENIEIIQVLE
jgi:DNA polymerase III sliding clamp (beta) subunit (PCNA family)